MPVQRLKFPVIRLLQQGRAWALAAAWLVAAGSASALSPERSALKRDREAADQQFQQAEAACKTRFAVADCINTAKAERREARSKISQRETALEQQERQKDTAEQRRKTADKTSPAALQKDADAAKSRREQAIAKQTKNAGNLKERPSKLAKQKSGALAAKASRDQRSAQTKAAAQRRTDAAAANSAKNQQRLAKHEADKQKRLQKQQARKKPAGKPLGAAPELLGKTSAVGKKP